MFKKRPLVFIPLIIAFGLTSCDKLKSLTGSEGSSEQAPQVQVVNGFAIVDLDLIASRLGQDSALQQALAAREAQINQELTRMQANYQRQIQIKVQELQKQQQEEGKEATPEQSQQLQEMVNTLNTQLVRARNTGQQTLNQEQVNLIQGFRNKVRPIAIAIARERGFSIVLTKNEAILFAYDEAFDITDEVIRRMSTPMVP